jgi:VIT1/CCC1 family predicted Fe2+/Mn2+ transporter
MNKKTEIQTEIDAAYLYHVLAENESDPVIANVFKQMSEIETSHAVAFSQKHGIDFSSINRPSWRAKAIHQIGKIMGYDYVLGFMMEAEKGISGALMSQKNKHQKEVSFSDTSHVKILKTILSSSDAVNVQQLSRFEKRHRSVGGNMIRASVLGGNDGLVSNFSLVMGVAGASGDSTSILLAGSAGLLAGALSMALGEWISVKSSQELYENQMNLEMEELEVNPEGEVQELKLIYMAKGIEESKALQMAREVMSDKSVAHEILVKEELGINAEELKGSAMQAAVSSFIMFAVGAIIPLLPFFIFHGYISIIVSAVLSALGLFMIGAAITLFTGRNVWFSGFRQVLFGLIAAAITFGIGKLIGVAIA